MRIFLRGRFIHPEGYVLRNGRAEQERLLRNEPNLSAQEIRRKLAHIHAVQRHRAARGVHQPRNQAHQRAFAASRMPHNRDRFPRGNPQIDAVQREPRRVLHRDVAKFNLTLALSLNEPEYLEPQWTAFPA